MEITIFNGKIHYKWSFSIAMLVYQRVTHTKNRLNICRLMADDHSGRRARSRTLCIGQIAQDTPGASCGAVVRSF
jgi:hypothetical protein